MALADYETRGHAAIVTPHRPETRHAIDPEVAVRLADAWQNVHDDESVRVCIVTGTGSAFCAPAELGQLFPLMSGARKPQHEGR